MLVYGWAAHAASAGTDRAATLLVPLQQPLGCLQEQRSASTAGEAQGTVPAPVHPAAHDTWHVTGRKLGLRNHGPCLYSALQLTGALHSLFAVRELGLNHLLALYLQLNWVQPEQQGSVSLAGPAM